jgi:hypothetical protein
MDPSQASMGEKIAAGSAVLLFISLFFPWYGVKVSAAGTSVSLSGSLSAWEAFGFIDILLFLCAVTAVGIVVAGLAGALPALPVPASQILLGVGAFALLLVLYRLIDTPAPDGLPDSVDFTRKLGLFIGLVAAGGMAYGGFQTTKEA